MAEVDINSFKPNSNKYKNDIRREERETPDKVIKGEVTVKKQSSAKQFAAAIFNEDGKTVKHYAIFDVIIPAIKNTLADLITGCVNTLFFGNSARSSGSSSVIRNSRTPYSSISTYKGSEMSGRAPKASEIVEKPNYREVILKSRQDAENVINTLYRYIEKYDEPVSVAYMFQTLGVTPDFTDYKWGWSDLRGAGVRLVRDGYLLELPEADLIS
jgi:hypothetical protein